MDKQNEKKSKDPKKTLKTVIIILIAFAACFGFGLLAGKLMKPSSGVQTVQRTPGEKITSAVTILISVYLSYFLTIIIHEGGHLVFGMASGYEFLSFRVGSLTLVRKDGKYEWKKFSIQGTGGQCLLMPPESDAPGNVPFFMYHAGGGVFNLITALICLPIAYVVKSDIPKTALFILGVFSVIQGLMNLIPLKVPLPNDGYNLLKLCKDPAERAAIYKTLRINGLLYKGLTPSEIPEDLYDLGSSSFYKTVEKMLKNSVIIDRHDYENAEKGYAECAEDDSIKVYQLESRCELMFCKIMNGAPAEEIDALYDKELQNYINTAGKTMISKRRLMYAYQLLYKHDTEAAEKEYAAAMKKKDTYPIEGELKSELSLIEDVRKRRE